MVTENIMHNALNPLHLPEFDEDDEDLDGDVDYEDSLDFSNPYTRLHTVEDFADE